MFGNKINLHKMRKLGLINSFLLTLFFLSACTNPCRDFDGVIYRALMPDSKIDQTEWAEILTYIAENEGDFEDCYDILFSDDNVDPDKVEDYIQELAKLNARLTSPVLIDRPDLKNDPITFKFYLESSKSVWYYDSGNVQGEFKHAIVSLLNNINRVSQQDNLMYIVNTVVEPYHKSYNDFIIQNNIFAGLDKIGNYQETNFEKIFSSILNGLYENEIAIMVSDLIYSTPDMGTKTPQLIANEVEGLMNNVFNRHADKVSVLVVKMLSSFDGFYSFFDPIERRENGFKHAGDRPYYFILFAHNETMERFLKNETYQQVRNFNQLNRFQNFYLFQESALVNPYYSILINHPETKSVFRIPKNKSKQIIGLDRVEPQRNSNEVSLAIGIDLSEIHCEESFKTNIDNYELSNSSFEIISIKPIEESDYIGKGSSTHVVLIRTGDPVRIIGDLSIKMKKVLPDWIIKTSTLDDTNRNVPNFENTTFAFEQMMSGVYKAFHHNQENACYFNITLKFSR